MGCSSFTKKQCLRKILILIASGCVYFSEKCKIHVKRIAVYLLIHVVRFFFLLFKVEHEQSSQRNVDNSAKFFKLFVILKVRVATLECADCIYQKLLEEVVVKLGGRLCFSNSCALQNCNAILKSFPNCRLSLENY